MPQVETQTGICSSCGALTDTSLFGDELTCMACLLRLGLAEGKRHASDDSLGTSVPDHIGPYVIARGDDGQACVLGHGAMGITFRATDESLQRPVALKIINTKLGLRSAEARERFTREARAAAALRHPNVATVYQFGVREETGQFFYAMELVEGETLEERVRRLGPLDVLTTIDVALQVTAALAAAEERGLVHRDLKPGNLMLVGAKDNGAATVKVIDFGVAKAISEKTNTMALTHGGFVGTPAFASPEQFTNAPVDVRSDIYSLGVTLWFLLTGHMLFSGRTVEEMRDARRSKPLPIEQLKAARVPHRFITLLTSMLAIEPVARPAGARELATKLQAIRASITGRRKTVQRFAVAAAVSALLTIVGIRAFHSRPATPVAPPIPEKSIAALPFENFSDDKENAYFADGVQDEILTDLTKVADLKVISRRSVAQYRDTKQSIREIGRALGVAHVLAGTVRKAAGRIHVTVQLIDAHNEAETWAEKYDRDVADVFLIQSDISQEIVSRLKASLSPEEKAAIEEKPTQDKEAYDLYLRARSLIYGQFVLPGKTQAENATKAVTLLESAIARDPKFILAYCVLGDAQLNLDYFVGHEDEAPLVKAKEAIDAALRISPNSAEAHLVLARYSLHGLEDVSATEKELAIAAAGLPGRVDVFDLRAEVEEQQGKWKEALRDREKAAELDPRDRDTADGLATLYICLRRYGDAERLLDHTIATTPQQSTAPFWERKSDSALARGDAKTAMAALDACPDRNLALVPNQKIMNVYVMERDYTKAEGILQSIDETAKTQNAPPGGGVKIFPNIFQRARILERLGRLARFRGEKEKARGYFEAARPNFEQWLAKIQKHHTFANSWWESHSLGYIAEIDAALGRNEDAIREAKGAVELWSLKRDARIAPHMEIFLAIVYMWAGKRDAALEQLDHMAKLPAASVWFNCPAGASAGDFKLNPLWDELRNDPRFDKIVAEAAKPIKLD
jgi:serine/threonine protein kinase/Tfp pilus assembly protein PilF